MKIVIGSPIIGLPINLLTRTLQRTFNLQNCFTLITPNQTGANFRRSQPLAADVFRFLGGASCRPAATLRAMLRIGYLRCASILGAHR